MLKQNIINGGFIIMYVTTATTHQIAALYVSIFMWMADDGRAEIKEEARTKQRKKKKNTKNLISRIVKNIIFAKQRGKRDVASVCVTRRGEKVE